MSEMLRLRKIMERLRGPEGCPWDREQTLQTLRTYLIEEAYEVLEAIDSGSSEALREELGDLLLQIVFQARVMEEQGAFDLESIIKGTADKITRRHPHVFGDDRLDTADQVLQQWEQIKAVERSATGKRSMFSGVPSTLPALLKAMRISAKAARVGFDWSSRESLWAKVDEEIGEVKEAMEHGDKDAVAAEIGDLLFTIANVARREQIDPEQALQDANRKFLDRFAYLEAGLEAEGLAPSVEHRDRMEALWDEAKRALRKT